MMTIHSHTTHTIYGQAYRMTDGKPERYGVQYEHHVIDGKVFIQVDAHPIGC